MSIPTPTPTGSPPRQRGAHANLGLRVADGRITPASAGSAAPNRMTRSARTDHPRVSGEHAEHLRNEAGMSGSPPRQRGARPRRGRPERGLRITPASAGSTPTEAGTRAKESDHPRVSGEHKATAYAAQPGDGSPPRQRGARRAGQPRVRRIGITPASAGSTADATGAGRPCSDHPRVSGEHAAFPRPRACRVGSPPRQRGALYLSCRIPPKLRITPASAGSTAPRPRAPAGSADHPRVSGEHEVPTSSIDPTNGSPPRQRGARDR